MRWIRALPILVVEVAHADGRDGAVPLDRNQAALAAGAFIPAPLLTPVNERAGLVTLTGGFAEDGPTFASAAELVLARRVALRASFASTDDAQYASAIVQVSIAHGISVAAGYDGFGPNTVPAISARVGYATDAGPVRVLATAGYSAGLLENERAGEVSVAGAYALGDHVQIGAFARGSLDLERDADEPAEEPDWLVVAAPFGAIALREVVVSASCGVQALRYRLADRGDVGVIATLGLGRAF